MKKISIALSAAAMIAAASPATARDFAGPYIGAGATLDNVQGSGDFEGLGFSGLGATTFAGYNMPVGDKAFVGIEANADIYSADIDGADVKADWGWGIGARAGFKLNDSTALYARGGYARARVSADGEGAWGDGARYGVGVETGLTDKLSLRVEASQFNYEDDAINNQVSLSLSYGF